MLQIFLTKLILSAHLDASTVPKLQLVQASVSVAHWALGERALSRFTHTESAEEPKTAISPLDTPCTPATVCYLNSITTSLLSSVVCYPFPSRWWWLESWSTWLLRPVACPHCGTCHTRLWIAHLKSNGGIASAGSPISLTCSWGTEDIMRLAKDSRFVYLFYMFQLASEINTTNWLSEAAVSNSCQHATGLFKGSVSRPWSQPHSTIYHTIFRWDFMCM